jgi:Xaa-Pro aminopeptidase
VGLHIHEKPGSGAQATDAERLVPGTIFTVEPGLYYPERGLGVRLEDTAYMRVDGSVEVLAPYPLDLVLPIKR